jgi:uncharacterized membrane protein
MRYLLAEEVIGLLQSKSSDLLSSSIWQLFFNLHIIFGGIALLVGWTQFSEHVRNKYRNIHLVLGKIYVFAVFISGISALYIAVYATGGWVAKSGFFCLGIIWLFTTIQAYRHARSKFFSLHEKMMIYSFAACFAAVTLRLWLAPLSVLFGEFIPAYRLVAWLCWVPNIIVAFFIVRQKGLNRPIAIPAVS